MKWTAEHIVVVLLDSFDDMLSLKIEKPIHKGECLLISSLPGKALKTLVAIARLAKI